MAYVFSLVDPDHVFFHKRALQRDHHPLSNAVGSVPDFAAYVAKHGRPRMVLVSYGHRHDLAAMAEENPELRRTLRGVPFVIIGGKAGDNADLLNEARQKGVRLLHVAHPSHLPGDIIRFPVALADARREAGGSRVTREMYERVLKPAQPLEPATPVRRSRFHELVR